MPPEGGIWVMLSWGWGREKQKRACRWSSSLTFDAQGEKRLAGAGILIGGRKWQRQWYLEERPGCRLLRSWLRVSAIPCWAKGQQRRRDPCCVVANQTFFTREVARNAFDSESLDAGDVCLNWGGIFSGVTFQGLREKGRC